MIAQELGELVPRQVFERFLELTTIPRPSREEDEARRYVHDWAAARGWETETDDAGNIVVRVPASASRERAPLVVLQAHLDMVCERDPDSPYDPREGRIRVVRDGDWLFADGTTLGADNGIGVALALGAAEDPEIVHGPLELLFTVCEEQGLEGAKALDPDLVSGRLLLNLDGTSDGALTIGCAGSAHTFVRLELAPEPVSGMEGRRITLGGARGGHSGGDIHRGRANAIVALGRLLSAARADTGLRLAELRGGVSRNAIPRDAQALVAVRPGHGAALEAALQHELEQLRGEHAGSDDGLTLKIEADETPQPASDEATSRALALLAGLPTGVVTYAGAEDVVETSTSLNVASTEDAVLTLASMTRSSRVSGLEQVIRTIEAAAADAGAELEVVRSYPPWEPDPDSSLLASAAQTFRRLHGHDPVLEIVHGGLECAVIGEKLPGVQMLSLGPTVVGPHAPGERLSIPATERCYELLAALLDDLSG